MHTPKFTCKTGALAALTAALLLLGGCGGGGSASAGSGANFPVAGAAGNQGLVLPPVKRAINPPAPSDTLRTPSLALPVAHLTSYGSPSGTSFNNVTNAAISTLYMQMGTGGTPVAAVGLLRSAPATQTLQIPDWQDRSKTVSYVTVTPSRVYTSTVRTFGSALRGTTVSLDQLIPTNDIPSNNTTVTSYFSGNGINHAFEATNALGATQTLTVTAYRKPADMQLASSSGDLVGSNPRATFPYDFRFFTSGNNHFHYLGGQYGAIALAYQRPSGDTSTRAWMFGIPAPHALLSQPALDANYIIPVGGAFGHLLFTGNWKHLVYNQQPGTLSMNFSRNLAFLNITLSNAVASNIGFEVNNYEMTVTDDGFVHNRHCKSGSANNSAKNCAGAVKVVANGFNAGGSSNAATRSNNNSGEPVLIHGRLHGNKAQEVALGMRVRPVRVSTGGGSVGNLHANIAFLGRRAASTVASTSGGSLTDSGGTRTYSAILLRQAETAAFEMLGNGVNIRAMHYGTPAPASVLANLSQESNAVYTIPLNTAQGIFTPASGINQLGMSNSEQFYNHRLVANFRDNTAALYLQMQAAGAYATSGSIVRSTAYQYGMYQIDGATMNLSSGAFTCSGNCGGSVTANIRLSAFNDSTNMQINGAIYGSQAEQAAAALRHHAPNGDRIDIGFKATRASEWNNLTCRFETTTGRRPTGNC